MKLGFFSTLLVAVVCTGCVSFSQSELMHSKKRYEFSVDQPYQQVFDTVLNQVKRCYRDSRSVWDQFAVAGHRNNRDRTGLITVDALYNEADSDSRLLIEVKAVSESKTEVVAHYHHFWDRREAGSVEKWVVEGTQSCRA